MAAPTRKADAGARGSHLTPRPVQAVRGTEMSSSHRTIEATSHLKTTAETKPEEHDDHSGGYANARLPRAALTPDSPGPPYSYKKAPRAGQGRGPYELSYQAPDEARS